jgi:hypothetical protein
MLRVKSHPHPPFFKGGQQVRLLIGLPASGIIASRQGWRRSNL